MESVRTPIPTTHAAHTTATVPESETAGDLPNIAAPRQVDDGPLSVEVASTDATVMADLQQLFTALDASTDVPRTLAVIHRLFDRELNGVPTPNTAFQLIDSLGVLLDDEMTATALLNVVARSQADPTYRARALGEAPPDVAPALRELVAVHGKQAMRSLLIQDADSLGWSDFARYVYRELVADLWRVRVVITLNNGEELSIRDTPESIAVLAEALLDTLTYLPPQVLSELISTQRRERLRDVFGRFDAIAQDGSNASSADDGPQVFVPVPTQVSSPEPIRTDASV